MFVDDNNVQCHEIPWKIDLNRSKLIFAFGLFFQAKWNVIIFMTQMYANIIIQKCVQQEEKRYKKDNNNKTYFTYGYYHILHVKMCDMKCVMCNELT